MDWKDCKISFIPLCFRSNNNELVCLMKDNISLKNKFSLVESIFHISVFTLWHKKNYSHCAPLRPFWYTIALLKLYAFNNLLLQYFLFYFNNLFSVILHKTFLWIPINFSLLIHSFWDPYFKYFALFSILFTTKIHNHVIQSLLIFSKYLPPLCLFLYANSHHMIFLSCYQNTSYLLQGMVPLQLQFVCLKYSDVLKSFSSHPPLHTHMST